jgi:hypothetical protein
MQKFSDIDLSEFYILSSEDIRVAALGLLLA